MLRFNKCKLVDFMGRETKNYMMQKRHENIKEGHKIFAHSSFEQLKVVRLKEDGMD